MRLRATANLFVLLVVLGAVLLLVKRHEGAASGGSGTSERLVRATAAEISEITWSCSNATVKVVRKGGDWFLERPVRARASMPSVMQLVAALDRTRVRETISPAQREARGLDLAAFGLAPPRVSVNVGTARDSQLIHVGHVAPLGESLYLREGSQNEVLAASPQLASWCKLEVNALRDSAVLRGSAAAAGRIDLQRAGKPFVQLVREEHNGWWLRQPVNARADQVAVEQVLAALYGLHAAGYEWDPPTTDEGVDLSEVVAKVEEFGLAEDQAAVRVGVWSEGDSLGQEVIFGAVGAEGERFAKRRDATSILRVPANALDALTGEVAAYRDRRVFVVDPAALQRLSFSRGERKVTVEHTAETGWLVTEPADWQADSQVLTGFLGPAMGMVFTDFVPRSETNAVPSNAVPYVVAAWTDVAGEPVAQFELFRMGPTNSAIVRLPSGEMGLVAPHQIAWVGEELLDPLTFRNRLVVALPRSEVFRIVQAEGEVRREVVRGEDGQWTASGEGRTIRAETIESILFYASNLRAMRAWTAKATPEQLEEWGVAGTGRRSLTFGLQNGESIQKTLLFGRDAASGGTFTMVRGQPVVFLLPPLLVDQLMVPVATAATTVKEVE